MLLTSVLIEMGDIEIHIRRSTRGKDEYTSKETMPLAPARRSSAIRQNGYEEKSKTPEEKPNPHPTHWDYSASHGKPAVNSDALHLSLTNEPQGHLGSAI